MSLLYAYIERGHIHIYTYVSSVQAKYVVVVSGEQLLRINIAEVVNVHAAMGNDITLLVHGATAATAQGQGVVQVVSAIATMGGLGEECRINSYHMRMH